MFIVYSSRQAQAEQPGRSPRRTKRHCYRPASAAVAVAATDDDVVQRRLVDDP